MPKTEEEQRTMETFKVVISHPFLSDEEIGKRIAKQLEAVDLPVMHITTENEIYHHILNP